MGVARGGGQGRTRNRPAGLAAAHRTNSVLHHVCVSLCVCQLHMSVSSTTSLGKGGGKAEEERGTLPSRDSTGNRLFTISCSTDARLSHRKKMQQGTEECEETAQG